MAFTIDASMTRPAQRRRYRAVLIIAGLVLWAVVAVLSHHHERMILSVAGLALIALGLWAFRRPPEPDTELLEVVMARFAICDKERERRVSEIEDLAGKRLDAVSEELAQIRALLEPGA